MLIGVAAFLLLLIALLAIPITLTFKLSWHQSFESDINLRWAFGLVRVKIPTFETTTSGERSEKPAVKKRRFRRRNNKRWNMFAAVRHSTFRRRIVRFLGDLWRAVRKRNVVLRMRLGLGDPADTGQLWAVVGPISGVLANARDARIQIEPEFFEMTLEVDGSGVIRVVPLQIVYLIFALFLSPPIWHGIRQMRAAG